MKVTKTKEMAYAINSIALANEALAVSNSTVTEILVYPNGSDNYIAYQLQAGTGRQNRIITTDSKFNNFAAIANAGKNIVLFNNKNEFTALNREHFLFENIFSSQNSYLWTVLRKPQSHIYVQLDISQMGEIGFKKIDSDHFELMERSIEALACVSTKDFENSTFISGNLSEAPYAFGVMNELFGTESENGWLHLKNEPANFSQIVFNSKGQIFVMAEFADTIGFWIINTDDGSEHEVKAPFGYAFDSYAITSFRNHFYILYTAEDKHTKLMLVDENFQTKLAIDLNGKSTKGIAASDDFIAIAIETQIVFLSEE